MSTMSHGMADVKWHSLSGLHDYFVEAMANLDFQGDQSQAHTAADTGAEFTLRHSSPLSYMNTTWKIPVKDLVAIYERLYAQSSTRVPEKEHIQYCMAAAFAASKVDVEFGQWMFSYFGSKSPFLVEELYAYPRGGIQDLSMTVSECYPQMVDAFEHGATHDYPDTLCASYFNTHIPCHSHQTHAGIQNVHQQYDPDTGILTLSHLVPLSPPAQTVFVPHMPSSCSPLDSSLTLSLNSFWEVGRQTTQIGSFLALSAPYHLKSGAVFLVNSTGLSGHHELTQIPHSLLLQDSCPGRFGWAMVALDFNHDGLVDLAVACASELAPSIFIYKSGPQGLEDQPVQIKGPFSPTVLVGSPDGDLVVGCPQCTIENQAQAGKVFIYSDRRSPIVLENPNMIDSAYDRFGQSILFLKNLILVSAPGYSVGRKQRVGKIYAFDRQTFNKRWTMTGSKEFQQFGKVMTTNERNILAISSPSEETIVGLNKHWQAGVVRLYDIGQIVSDFPADREVEFGMIKTFKGKTNAGHLGKSLSITKDDELWIGEPMADGENGRIHKWVYGEELECFKNNKELARFGTQIEQVGTDTCVTSQRYGKE